MNTNNTDRKQAGRRRFLKRFGIGLGVCAGIYTEARYIEPRVLDVSRHVAYLPELPLALDGLLVAHLSDLHHGPITPVETIRDAVTAVVEASPGVVMLTGDFIHNHIEQAADLATILGPLHAVPLGLFACLGNHDYRDRTGDLVAMALLKSGIAVLRNESHVATSGLSVVGIEDTTRGLPDPLRALAGVPADAACVFLTHNPVGIWGATRRSCLALSGHTHGGQVRIPGMPIRRPVGMEGFPLLEGWGAFDRARLFISRGVAMMGIPLRFRCPPEVALITLKRGNGQSGKSPDAVGRAAVGVKQFGRDVIHRRYF